MLLAGAGAVGHLALNFSVHLSVGEFDLLVYKDFRLLIHLRLDLCPDLFSLLQPLQLLLVFAFDESDLLSNLILRFLLLGDALLRLGQLLLQALLFAKSVEAQCSAASFCLEMGKNVIKDGLLELLLDNFGKGLGRHVVWVEDLVLAAGESSDRKNEPALVGVVLLLHLDAALHTADPQVLEELLHEYDLGGGLNALPINYVLLPQAENLAGVHAA